MRLSFSVHVPHRLSAGALLLMILLLASFVPERAERPAGFVEPDFPFITTTVDARDLGAPWPDRNVAVRGLALQLGNGAYAVFDPDLLRMAVGWRGEFLSLTSMAQVSYEEWGNKRNGIPRVLGTPIFATGLYAGWTGAGARLTDDPRPAGPNPEEIGRGPLPDEAGRWNGVYLVGKQAVLAYSVRGTEIHEQPGSLEADGEVGIVRTFRVGPSTEDLTLVAAELSGVETGGKQVAVSRPDSAGRVLAVGLSGAAQGVRLEVEEGRYVTVRVPRSASATEFSVVAWRGDAERRSAFDAMLRTPVEMVPFAQGGPARWPEAVAMAGRVAPDTAAFVLDDVTLPLENPWKRNVRVAGIGFFADGRAALSTFEGDVWVVSGIDRGLREVRWRRFASGLYEPMSLAVVDERILVFGREGIVRLHDLNEDGEADFYENFSNLAVQTLESREYPLGMAAGPDGSLYLSKGAALDNGPKTSPAVMPGLRAGGPHSGTILRVSPDGRTVTTFATGLREPFLGVHPRTGIVTASDQQGNFVPSTPIYVIREGDYFGVPATAHGAAPEEPVPPLTWIPHQVDQSGAGQAWITGGRMGPLNESLIHFSYGRPGAFRVYIDSTHSVWQGAITLVPGDYAAPVMKGAVSPVDGQLYMAGFQVWDSKAREVSGLVRLRYTGKPSPLPSDVRAGSQGIVLRFDVPLDAETATRPERYGLERWNYRRTERYGSGHFKTDGSPGQESLSVAAAHLSGDGKSVLLIVPDMREVEQMALSYDLTGADGLPLKSDVYLTVNHLAPFELEEMGFPGVDVEAALAAAHGTAAVVDEGVASAQRGREIYEGMGCAACHSIDGTMVGKSGPTFRGAYGTARRLTNGGVVQASEAYFRQSIMHPASQIVEGYQEEMPSYLGVLSDSDIQSVVLFIKSLGVQ